MKTFTFSAGGLGVASTTNPGSSSTFVKNYHSDRWFRTRNLTLELIVGHSLVRRNELKKLAVEPNKAEKVMTWKTYRISDFATSKFTSPANEFV